MLTSKPRVYHTVFHIETKPLDGNSFEVIGYSVDLVELVARKMDISKSRAKQLIKQGAVKVNNKRITGFTALLEEKYIELEVSKGHKFIIGVAKK